MKQLQFKSVVDFALIAVLIALLATRHVHAQPGPFLAGHDVYTAIDSSRGDRELLTDVWYPVDAADAVGQPPLEYYQHYNGGEDFWWYESPFYGGVQGAPAADEGGFPLVVLSHGNGGAPLRFQLLAETLASNGYVVAAPRHTGNAWGTPQFNVNRDRPIDVSFIIDDVIERSGRSSDILAGAVDPQRIGVGGYSRGVETIIGTTTGVEFTDPPVPSDTRPKAALFIDGAGTSTMDIPILHVGGAQVDFGVAMLNPSAPVFYGLDLDNAHHSSFGTNLCQYADELIAAEAPPEVFDTTGTPGNYSSSFWPGCQEGLIDPTEAQTLSAEQALAFFNLHLRGDEADRAMLLPSAGESTTHTVRATFTPALPRGSQFDLLLTAPDGRRLGVDSVEGPVNDYPPDDARYRTSTSKTLQQFIISGDEVVPGEYSLTGHTTDVIRADQSLEVSVEASGSRGPHTVSVRLSNAAFPVGPDSEVGPYRFGVAVPEPSAAAMFLIGMSWVYCLRGVRALNTTD